MSAWPGNIISGAASAVAPTGPFASNSALGIWDASEKGPYQNLGQWPLGGLGVGEASFTNPGTYSWVAPAMASVVSVVCVGGGGYGGGRGPGTGGGALAFSNGVSITPGATYTIVVGNRGASPGSYSSTSNPGENSSAFSCVAGGGQGTNGGFLGGVRSGTFSVVATAEKVETLAA